MNPILTPELISLETIESQIYEIRDRKVMLDRDLAKLYGVETKVLNQAVKRNHSRFPKDFMFILSKNEANFLRSQFVTLEIGRGQYSKYLPFAFTEDGIAMLSSVLNSEKAIQMNIQIMRVFTQIRKLALTNLDVLKKLQEIEGTLLTQSVINSRNDQQFKVIFEAIHKMFETKPTEKIGFLR